ncbi:MAG: DNA cytosine methylase [Candidatus Methanofastidiosum methylothiophilum]|uniref:DNA cytosine methylase n=1 Tax=Candidatus Methanofastidiosum methylothiophilum TaxID=1705564 RepID=A0A150J6G1_9EURY|nr:MAG: DNA cytosine methylase [Candidatus Methanofastidiosum methylthiophilus]
MIEFFDLFGGIGGFRYGLDHSKNRYKCVGYCDFSKQATACYNYNFNEQHEPTDARTIDTNILPDFDMLCGGFPCQSFSLAGKRRGFDDTRGTVFYEIARIAKDKRPRILFLENVKGLLYHDKGNTFSTILCTLGELGYELQFIVYNTRKEGRLPQNRERLFIIGNIGNGCPRKILPFGEDDTRNICARDKPQTEGKWFPETVSCIDHNYWKGGSTRSMIVQPILTPYRLKKRQNGRRIKEDGEPMFTLTSQDIHGVYIDKSIIRRLTPVECERLQGFPDNWTKYGKKGNDVIEFSDTWRYKMIGNSVTTTVISYIGDRIL